MPSTSNQHHSLPSRSLLRNAQTTAPIAFHSADRRKSRLKVDERTPLHSSKQPRQTKSAEVSRLQPRTKPIEPRLRQTTLFEKPKDTLGFKPESQRFTNDPSSSTRKTSQLIPSRSSHAQQNVVLAVVRQPRLSQSRSNLGHDPSLTVDAVQASSRSLLSETPLLRSPAPAPNRRVWRESGRPLETSAEDIEHNVCSNLVSTPLRTNRPLLASRLPPEKEALHRMTSVDTHESCLPAIKRAHGVASSDTIEQLHTSPPPILSPRLPLEDSPLPPQSFYPLGLDIETQCSPLPYQLLHPKEKIHSVNRAHGGWLETRTDFEADASAELEDKTIYHVQSPMPRVSRHRAAPHDRVDHPRTLIDLQLRPQTGGVMVPTTRQLDGHSTRLPTAYTDTTAQDLPDAEPDLQSTLHEMTRPRILCAESPASITRPVRPPLLHGTVSMGFPSSNLMGLCSDRSAESEPDTTINPTNFAIHEGAVRQGDNMNDAVLVESLLSQTRDIQPAFLLPESMMHGRMDWDGEDDVVSSPTPHLQQSSPQNQCEHERFTTLMSTDVEPNYRIGSSSGETQYLRETPSKRVLVEESQEDSPSKRARTLAENSQPSPRRKPTIRSLAPPTPIAVRFQHQRQLMSSNQLPVSSTSPRLRHSVDILASPSKPKSTSPLKNVLTARSWKERSRQAWTTDPEAQIINETSPRQANITEFFNLSRRSGSVAHGKMPCQSVEQNYQDTSATAQTKLQSRLLEQVKKTFNRSREPWIAERVPMIDDDIEDETGVEPILDLHPPDGDIVCQDSQDEDLDVPTIRDLEQVIERRRHRCAVFAIESPRLNARERSHFTKFASGREETTVEPDLFSESRSYLGAGPSSADIDLPTQELAAAADAMQWGHSGNSSVFDSHLVQLDSSEGGWN